MVLSDFVTPLKYFLFEKRTFVKLKFFPKNIFSKYSCFLTHIKMCEPSLDKEPKKIFVHHIGNNLVSGPLSHTEFSDLAKKMDEIKQPYQVRIHD